ncbi:MAG: AAA-like domain-containing protein [Fibrobacterota bacterium]|nr:AAA-like domain-containing protein [Fibrobacterota bacterium]QQS07242.1 MAG: AAA-like domain-containing protein [Fibrobacterota bacterium]
MAIRSKSFNTTGPCRPQMHYMLPPEARLPGADLQRMIDEELYWVLHAPRQTGKTSFLMSWMKTLNASEQVVACYVSVERCQGIEDVERAMEWIVDAILESAVTSGVLCPARPASVGAGSLLSATLTSWAGLCAPKPLVVLFDEVDTLLGAALISFLRQLRGGFASRGVGRFPTSVALVGMRDLKGYIVQTKDGVAMNPGSPFNIKKDSYTLRNFSELEIRSLLGQHTEATGQVFTEEALAEVCRLTCGQPWLVNTLADLSVTRLVTDGSPVTADHIEAAKEELIKSRAVHIDSLAERLRDPKVKRVVQPILAGASDPTLAEGDEFRLCMDLGLVTLEEGVPSIANPIYREVLIRTLNYGQQLAIPAPEFRWKKADGDLDMETLFDEFQSFWRENGDLWEEKADYTEVFPHLLLMAFFQRVLNGGARLTREAAVGRERMDMLIEWQGFKHIVEIKLVHPRKGRDATLQQGLKQIARYADKVGRDATRTLVIFDRTTAGRAMPWEERLRREEYDSVVVRWL